METNDTTETKEKISNGHQGGDVSLELAQHGPYVKPGFFGLFQSKYVVLCAFVVRLGGFLFGYGKQTAASLLRLPSH